jgi:type IV pilus assembly protein PilV
MLITKTPRNPGFGKLQRGSSLLEVLVSILLMSFGMLAMAGMQAYAISAQKNAANRAIASTLANEYAEIIRLNAAGFAAGSYDGELLTSSASPDVPADEGCGFQSANICTSVTLSQADTARFLAQVRRTLPQGGIKLTRPTVAGTPSVKTADLWIMWEEGNIFADASGGSSTEGSYDNCPAEALAQATLPRCFYMKVEL